MDDANQVADTDNFRCGRGTPTAPSVSMVCSSERLASDFPRLSVHLRAFSNLVGSTSLYEDRRSGQHRTSASDASHPIAEARFRKPVQFRGRFPGGMLQRTLSPMKDWFAHETSTLSRRNELDPNWMQKHNFLSRRIFYRKRIVRERCLPAALRRFASRTSHFRRTFDRADQLQTCGK